LKCCGAAKAAISLTSALGILSTTNELIHLAGMVLFAPLGWIIIRRIRRRYEVKPFSDQVLIFDSIWLFQTPLLCQELIFDAAWRGWIGPD